MKKKIFIFDTTLRDGEQTPGVSLNMEEKLEIARRLEVLGVDVLEAGFPVASQGDFKAVKTIAEHIRKPVIVGLARTMKADIDRTWEALQYAEKPRIHVFLATSDMHMQYKLHMTEAAVLASVREMVAYAKSLGPSVEFSPEDGSRTRPAFLYQVLETAIEAGADILNIPDTVGYCLPNEFGRFIRGIRENVKAIDTVQISVHCHNDLGLAVANSLAAIENGATQVECAMNGLGERAGNAALEEIVMAVKTRVDQLPYYTDINTAEIMRTSRLVSHLTGIPVQPNKAVVGANAFAHESGIHQHGVLSKRETYEIMTPESVGLKNDFIILGKHSGRHAFAKRLEELGYLELTPQKIDEAFFKFKDLADKKSHVSNDDIEALVISESARIPEVFKLTYFQIHSGNTSPSTSTVQVTYNDKQLEEVSLGDGPVDATFKAIEKALGINVILKSYDLKAVSSGKDALGEVSLRIEKDDHIYSGKGISTDVVESSAKAFMNALNKMHHDVQNVCRS